MTDDNQANSTPDSDEPQARPTPPSAAAARRARRIGGRPAPSAGPHPDQPAAASPTPADGGDQPREAKLGRLSFTKAKQVKPDAGAAEPPASVFPPPPPAPRVSTAPGTPPPWLNWAPAAVLSAGAVVMAVLIVAFSHNVWWGSDPSHTPDGGQRLREQVMAAAKTCVAATNTYKYTDLNTFETKALGCATGEFRNQLKSTIDTLIKVNAPKLKSSQTAQINRGGLEAISQDGRQWTILLYGQLSVTNSNESQPRTDPFAAQVRMQKVQDKWLISALTTVATPLS
jgi:hypothetical protein